MSRKIHWVVIHCSDSDIKAHDNIETIRGWHVNERNFSDIGYHYFIDKSGAVHSGRSEDTVGAHVKGHNSGSLGICLSGRGNTEIERKLIKAEKDPKKKEKLIKIHPTREQETALELLCLDITQRHELDKKDILGHCDLDGGKTCPNFDLHKLVSSWEWH